MKRAISFILTFMLSFSLVGGAIPKATAASWSAPYLENLVDRDVMKGDPYGNLYPDRLITRAEFSAMLNRAFGFAQKGSKGFKDVPNSAWYASDIDIAAYQGYLQGTKSGAIPTGYLTREQAATMLCRALKIESIEGESFNLIDERNFSNWSRGYINAAVEKRFVSGYPDGSFKPVNKITRGEAAKMLSEVAGEIVTSDNDNSVRGYVDGNLTIASSGVTLSDVTIEGDLYITEGVGLGYVRLDDVSVIGEVIISGAGESNVGESSVILTDCSISKLIVDVAKRKILTLKTDGNTSVDETWIKSSTYLEELTRHYDGFDKVTVDGPPGTKLYLTGSFGDVRLNSPEATLNLHDEGEVSGITVDEAAEKCKIFLEKNTFTDALYFDTGATVSGEGEIDSVLINNDGVTIAQLPDNIYIRPGVIATINGKKMNSLDAEMDSLEPDFSRGYPDAPIIQAKDFTEAYMTNKPGKVYYAVYPDGESKPTTEQLMTKSGPPKNALKYGNLNIMPEKEVGVRISGLKSGTQYVVYSLFVDSREGKSDIEKNYVETVDDTIPTLLSGYPKISSIDRDRAMIELTPNKDTNYYWAVLPSKSVAPTVDQLYAQNISGALSKGVNTKGIMNTTQLIDTSNGGKDLLEESIEYTFYVVLRDKDDNMSKNLYKFKFTTKDLTPPSFYPEDTYEEITYPKAVKINTTSIQYEYMVNETCTVYWLAAKAGSNILPLGSDGKPEFTSQKARDIIKGGSGGTKSGKATAAKTQNRYTINVSGLERQMPYDVYFLLEDKEGNQSNVKMVTDKTQDTVPPTASVQSMQEINGFFSVDRPFSIYFSEIVCSSETDASGNFIPFSSLFQSQPDRLDQYIQLMDTTKVPEEKVAIDWSEVTVKDVDAQTVITFSENAVPLSNNNSYRFDLGYISGLVIRDTSKNEMRSKTPLPFKTVPPLTYFTEVKNIDASRYDGAFLIKPDAQRTGQYMYFDIMLRSNYDIEFELYSSTTNIEDLKSIGGIHTLRANYATPISSFVVAKTYENLDPTYYALKLTKIGSMDIVDGKAPITADVNLLMNAVIGNSSKLGQLQGNADTFDSRLKTASDRGDVSEVTAPDKPFSLYIALVDSIPPDYVIVTDSDDKVIIPGFTAGDTQVVMKIKTTKACDVYYLAMPLDEEVSQDQTENSIRNAKSDAARGIQAGSFHVPDNSGIATEYTITGLLPEKEYVIHYFLKGRAPGISSIRRDTFQTIEVASPKFVEMRYTPGNRSVNLYAQLDSDCTVYYVVYPKGTYGTTAGTMPSVENIMNPGKGGQLIAKGEFTAKEDETIKTNITSDTGLEYTSKYSLYAVAQKYIGNAPAGSPSSVVCLPTMSPRDTDPPSISGGEAKSVTTYDSATGRFTSVVGLTFSEALYYFEQGSSDAKPLTKDVFEDGFDVVAENSTFSITDYNEDKVPLLDDNGDPTGSTENCLRSISIKCSSIVPGTTINFSKTIGDRALNYAGTLRLTFQVDPEDPENPAKASWVATFLPAKP